MLSDAIFRFLSPGFFFSAFGIGDWVEVDGAVVEGGSNDPSEGLLEVEGGMG